MVGQPRSMQQKQQQQMPQATQRVPFPAASPWRGGAATPVQQAGGRTPTQPSSQLHPGSSGGMPNGAPGQGQPQGQPLKLPALPRLGAQNQSASHQLSSGGPVPPTQSKPTPHLNSSIPSHVQQQQQPTFAQIVQQAQHSQQASKGTHTSRLTSLNGSNMSNSAVSNGASASPEARRTPGGDSAMNILGNVNSQMMPKVNTSYGMSGLNTVLPGMSKPSAAGGSKPSSLANTPMLQNLSLHERASPVASPAASQSPSTAAASASSGSRPQAQADVDRYGLKSLLTIMDSNDQERKNVILGTDLSQTGLDMGNTTDKLSHTFASPWQETSKHPVVPDYQLPACYSIDTVAPQQQKLQSFDEGALFYIFYTMPRDAMQEAAAAELTNRSWRYHKGLKMWLTKDPLSRPVQTNTHEESGIYIFFDPVIWKKVKREYVLYYPDIA